jgi:hypothetical protein
MRSSVYHSHGFMVSEIFQFNWPISVYVCFLHDRLSVFLHTAIRVQRPLGPLQVSLNDQLRRVEKIIRIQAGDHCSILLQVSRFQFQGIDPDFGCSGFELARQFGGADGSNQSLLELQLILAESVNSVVHMHHLCQFTAIPHLPSCTFFQSLNRIVIHHDDRINRFILNQIVSCCSTPASHSSHVQSNVVFLALAIPHGSAIIIMIFHFNF